MANGSSFAISRKLIAGLSAGLATLIVVVAAFAADSTIIVTGDTAAGENQPGWLFNRDLANATPIEFNTDAESIGLGSLYVLPLGAEPSRKFIGELFLLAPIADFNEISYDFLIGPNGVAGDANQFYMNVYANFGQTAVENFYDCRYNIVPSVGSTSAFTTVTFDPDLDYPVSTHNTSPFACPASPADMDLDSPGSTIRVIALNMGDTGPGDAGLDGYFDNVVLDMTAGTTAYDFEPYEVATSKDGCKQGGWQELSRADGSAFKNQGDCIQYVSTGN